MLPATGAHVRIERDFSPALGTLRLWRPEALLLDLDFTGIVLGSRICRHVRRSRDLSRTLILAVSSKSDSAREIAAFDAGVDDHVRRGRIVRASFAARLAALLRRAHPRPADISLHLEQLRLDPLRREAFLDGVLLPLTSTEFDVLLRLARHHGHTVPRAQLFEPLPFATDVPSSRALDMHVKQIRRKLGKAAGMLMTDYGKGYRLEVPGYEQAERMPLARAG